MLIVTDLKQLRHYMRSLQRKLDARTFEGYWSMAAREFNRAVVAAAGIAPRVEIVQYHLQVDFAGGSAG